MINNGEISFDEYVAPTITQTINTIQETTIDVRKAFGRVVVFNLIDIATNNAYELNLCLNRNLLQLLVKRVMSNLGKIVDDLDTETEIFIGCGNGCFGNLQADYYHHYVNVLEKLIAYTSNSSTGW